MKKIILMVIAIITIGSTNINAQVKFTGGYGCTSIKGNDACDAKYCIQRTMTKMLTRYLIQSGHTTLRQKSLLYAVADGFEITEGADDFRFCFKDGSSKCVTMTAVNFGELTNAAIAGK